MKAIVLGAAASLLAGSGVAAQATPQGLYAVKVAVHDVDRAVGFYRLLGLTQTGKPHPYEVELSWEQPATGPKILLVHNQPKRMADAGTSLLITVADVTATVERLKQAGFAGFTPPEVSPRSVIIYTRDPDGNQIELVGPNLAAAK